MRKLALFTALTLLVFGFGANLSAYEGGTKMIATMTHPQAEQARWGPVLLVPHNELTAGKPFLAFLHRLPQPILSAERLREEKAGQSLGTKGIVRFQKTGRG